MDLGITTFLFLILNCALLVLGLIRIIIAVALAIVSLFVFTHLKETTFCSYVNDAILTGMNEEALFILGILAGNKNNVRFLNTYQVFILLLISAKCLSLYELNKSEDRIKQDIDFSLQDAMNEYKSTKNSQPAMKANDIQRIYRCCGIDGPKFWKQVMKLDEIPSSCCPPKTDKCEEAKAYQKGCLEVMQSKLPFFLFNLHYYTMIPVFEICIFIVGIVLIIMVLKTAANSLA